MEKKIEALKKPYWFADDIMDFMDCSKNTAVKIKNEVAKKYGVIEASENKEKKAVKADDVIKYLGGNNREEEIRILSYLKGNNNGNL